MRQLVILIVISFGFIYISVPSYADKKISLDIPPASLGQWYKPENKRNVWHHNMFKLRRETQAVNEYMEEKDQLLTEKWALQLVKHYRKIADMVPEWEDELELEWADKLEAAAKESDFKMLKRAMKKIQTSCKGCHTDYRAQVATLYRSPDFSNIDVQLSSAEAEEKEEKDNTEKTSYLDFMKILMRDVNRIKIAASDGKKDKALLALKAVRGGIETLRSSCDSCHKNEDAKNYYLGEKTANLLDDLETVIDTTTDTRKMGQALGHFAVQACAKCHGSHRILYDLKHTFSSTSFIGTSF